MSAVAEESESFDAFISYRRSDGGRHARAIRRRLQTYRIKRHLKEYDRPALRVFLDTIYERGADDFYDKNILPALSKARYLIVIATPDAILRPDGDDWIQREISDFRKHCDPDNILVVRAAGDFLDDLPGDLNETLPNAQIIDLRGASGWSVLSPMQMGRLGDEWLKLIAPLFGVAAKDMPRLRREQERAQQTRFGIASGAVLGAFLFAVGVAAFAVTANIKASVTTADSLFAIGNLIRTTDRLPDDEDNDGVKGQMLDSACKMFDALSGGTMPNGYQYERALCDTDRARAYTLNEDLEQARAIMTGLRGEIEREVQENPTPNTIQAYQHLLEQEWQSAWENEDAPDRRQTLLGNLEEVVALSSSQPSSADMLQMVTGRLWALIYPAEEREDYEESRRLMTLGADSIDGMFRSIEESGNAKADQLRELNAARVELSRRLGWLSIVHLDDAVAGQKAAERALAWLEVTEADPLSDAADLNIIWEKVIALEVLGLSLKATEAFEAAGAKFQSALDLIAWLEAQDLNDEGHKQVAQERNFLEHHLSDLNGAASNRASEN